MLVADGAGSTADFTTVNIAGPRTITIDNISRTIGVLSIGDTDGTQWIRNRREPWRYFDF